MRNLIVGSAWLSPIALIILWQRAPMLGLAIMALSHAAWLYATLRANVQWLGPVITRFETNAREVWLTIDDGPTSDTPAILDLLQASRVAASMERGTSHSAWSRCSTCDSTRGCTAKPFSLRPRCR